MRTQLLAAIAIAAMTTSLTAQEPKPTATLPDGWELRLDRANANPAEVDFRVMAPGWHATTGPAAIVWNPEMTAAGEYTASVTMHLMKPSNHPEAFGLFIGGRDLSGEGQDYTYFLVRQSGEFLVKHRAGGETHEIVGWTAHPAIPKAGTDGSTAYALAVDVSASSLGFMVNGQEVGRVDRPSYFSADGVVGLRINHRLDVHIEDLSVEPKGR